MFIAGSRAAAKEGSFWVIGVLLFTCASDGALEDRRGKGEGWKSEGDIIRNYARTDAVYPYIILGVL